MADHVELSRRVRAIRRLATTFPAQGLEERLEKISGIAKGNLSPDAARLPTSDTFFELLKAGKESRTPRTAADKTEEALRRKRAKDEESNQASRGSARGKNRLFVGGRDRDAGDAA